MGTHLPHPADVCLVAAEGDSKTVEFSYSVKWKPTDVELEDRMDRYMQYSTKPQHLEVWAATGRLCRADGWGAGDTGPPAKGSAQCRGRGDTGRNTVVVKQRATVAAVPAAGYGRRGAWQLQGAAAPCGTGVGAACSSRCTPHNTIIL